MTKKPTYEELENQIEALEAKSAVYRKQENAMIRQLSEDFQQLADRSQDAIYQFDIESQTFPFFNKQFLSLYSKEVLISNSLRSCLVLYFYFW